MGLQRLTGGRQPWRTRGGEGGRGWLERHVPLSPPRLRRARARRAFPAAGVFSVLTFLQSVVWLSVSSSGLVAACLVLGYISGAPPALLGATVLAWGNSANDLAADVSMARDGFPTMAITACFASPLFQLLAGGRVTGGAAFCRSGCGCPGTQSIARVV